MNEFFEVLKKSSEYLRLCDIINTKKATVGITGAAEISKSHILAALCRDTGKRLAAIVPTELEAAKLAEEMQMFGIPAVQLSPADITVGETYGESFDLHEARIDALDRICGGAAAVLSAAALMCPVMSKEKLEADTWHLKIGGCEKDIAQRLVAMGYERTAEVTGAGQFALRGGIADIYSPGAKSPVRIEFFGDEVDSIRYFDAKSQLSIENAKYARILPANADKGTSGVLEYFHAENTVFALCEPRRLFESSKIFSENIEEKISSALINGKNVEKYPLLDFGKEVTHMKNGSLIGIGAISCAGEGFVPNCTLDIPVKILSSYSGKLSHLAEDTLYWQKQGYKIFILAGGENRARGIAEVFEDSNIEYKLLKDCTGERCRHIHSAAFKKL